MLHFSENIEIVSFAAPHATPRDTKHAIKHTLMGMPLFDVHKICDDIHVYSHAAIKIASTNKMSPQNKGAQTICWRHLGQFLRFL